jgi:hypothetical protein
MYNIYSYKEKDAREELIKLCVDIAIDYGYEVGVVEIVTK